MQALGADRYRARIRFGVGAVAAAYDIDLVIAEPRAGVFDVVGEAAGRLGGGRARGELCVSPLPRGGARIAWSFRGVVDGPVALAGAWLLGAASQRFCTRAIQGLDREVGAFSLAALTQAGTGVGGARWAVMINPAPPPEDDMPSGRSTDSLPHGAGVAGATSEDGRSEDPLAGDPEVEEGETGEGI